MGLGTNALIVIGVFVFVFVLTILASVGSHYFFRNTYDKFTKYTTIFAKSGQKVAEEILSLKGVFDIQVEKVDRHLSDNFNPKSKIISLSPEVFENNTISSQAVASHEAFHAIQYKTQSKLLRFRTWLVPFAGVANFLLVGIIVISILFTPFSLFQNTPLISAFIVVDCVLILFQGVSAITEIDASARAIRYFKETRSLTKIERATFKKVLIAAGSTYVSGFFSALLTLIPFIIIISLNN